MTSRGETSHIPVLPKEVLHWLDPRPGGRYLDATVGLGGHSAAILAHTAGQAEVLGLDRDADALAVARERLRAWSTQVHLFQSNFADAAVWIQRLGWGQVDGILADLGVSSLQLDTAERGFSFLHDGPLDMRMDQRLPETAGKLVNEASYVRLKGIIRDLGEEPLAGRIARVIVDAREKQPISSTAELARLVALAYPPARRYQARNHPATRTFQALRMAVNQELEAVEAFLRVAVELLAPGGRLVVISFHSLEDRLVKRFFRAEAATCVCPPRQPVCTCGHSPRLRILTRKPITPADAELAANPRSRSAKLRAAERLHEAGGLEEAR
ncbi:MAG: rRNA (cytosine1402-N4)-methyltransferase [Desulfomicrobiaceae bacterium]|jgi:16S rRNA (cytosine1402-N4)-methyltransferase|nr:rRNA (cytosine1402-N4)-methyltransferase [Desulfomicrobiaceae bacterium]